MLTRNYRPTILFRWLDLYEDLIGLKEVKKAQKYVNDAEQKFIDSQTERRTYSDQLIQIQTNLKEIRMKMEKFPRTDDKYLQLFQEEHQIIKKEQDVQHKLQTQQEQERDLLSSFQMALRQSQEKEKMRIERTKYWSVIGSIVGALMGIVGTTLSNRYRLQQYQHLSEESRKNIDIMTREQQLTIDNLKKEFQQVSSAAKDLSNEIQTFRHQSHEEQQQSDSKMTFLVVSTGVISLLLSFWLHQR